jgi:hypothetical protein
MSAPITALVVSIIAKIPVRYGDSVNGCEPLTEVDIGPSGTTGWLAAEPISPRIYASPYGLGQLSPKDIERIIPLRRRVVTWV